MSERFSIKRVEESWASWWARQSEAFRTAYPQREPQPCCDHPLGAHRNFVGACMVIGCSCKAPTVIADLETL